jgi:hypothetical protein
MIKLNTTNGHNTKVIDSFNEASIKYSDDEILHIILTYWADDMDLQDITEILNTIINENI